MSAEVEAYIDSLTTSETIKALFRQYGLGYAWIAMAVITLAMLATLLSTTIVNVAIPPIMGAYGIGQDQAQWLSTANLASSTVAMLLTSWLVQMWGIRLVVFWSMLLFLLGTVIGGTSPNVELMIFARVLQGIAAGIITPLSMFVVFLLFPFNRQGMVMGVSSIGVMLAPALGPTLGGVLTDTFNWRYVYYVCLVAPLLCIPLALIYLPDRDGEKPAIPFDWWGLILLSLGISLLFIGLSSGRREGWDSAWVLSNLGGGIGSSLGFIYWQLRNPTPLLNLAIFRHYRFAMYSIIGFVFSAGLYGSTYLIPLFLQLVQGMTPTDSGLLTMPAGLLMAVVAPFCGRLVDRYDPSLLIAWGSLLFSGSFILMVGADANTSFFTFAWWMAVGRIGIGFAFPSMSMGTVRSVPAELVGEASGVLNFMRQLGGAFGVNLCSLILAHRTEFHADAVLSTQRSDNAETLQSIFILEQQLSATGMPAIEKKLAAMQYLADSLHIQAMVSAFKDSFLVSALVFLAVLVPVWLIWRSKLTDAK
ncbi:MAG: DHA2 family multidrug resistance protein [Paraglaciecola psychrophila]|jgi:DHA2 family multidrug resistance protein